MPRRGENVYKRKAGRWEGRNLTGHDYLGKAVYQYFYGRTYREVKEKMLAYTPTEATDGRQPAANHFGDVLDIWLRHKKLTVKESSYAKYYRTEPGCHPKRCRTSYRSSRTPFPWWRDRECLSPAIWHSCV